jgi:hypothetical protein
MSTLIPRPADTPSGLRRGSSEGRRAYFVIMNEREPLLHSPCAAHGAHIAFKSAQAPCKPTATLLAAHAVPTPFSRQAAVVRAWVSVQAQGVGWGPVEGWLLLGRK